MNNIECKDGAVCFADNYQWKHRGGSVLEDVNGTGNLYFIEKAVNDYDFQLNEPRIGDYIEKSELDTEEKYNDAVEVFGLFGFKRYLNYSFNEFYSENSSCLLADEKDGLIGCYGISILHKRKLTYNQLMAIGKLKRMMNERGKGRFIIGESDEGLENAIPDSAKKNPNDNIEVTFNPSVNLERDFKKHIKDIESDIYNAVNKSATKIGTDNAKVTNNKYEREISDRQGNSANVDVYDVLRAFNVTCPATQHAVKKLLCSGIRGHKDLTTDLIEAKESIVRAIELNG